MRFLDIAGGQKVCSWAHVVWWDNQPIAVATNNDHTVIHMAWGQQFDTIDRFPLFATSSAWTKDMDWEAKRLKDDISQKLKEYVRYNYIEASVERHALEKLLRRNPGETILRFVQDYLVVGVVQTNESALLSAKTSYVSKECVFVTDNRRILNALPDEDFVSLFVTPQKPIMMIGTWGKQAAIISATKTQPKRTLFTAWLEAVAN